MSNRKGIMLCYPFEERRLGKWTLPVFIQPKLDGDRCRAILDSDGRCTLLSSEEHIITSVPHINLELEATGLKNIELDGELYHHGMTHEEIRSIVGRTVELHPDFTSMEYHVFDVIFPGAQCERLMKLVDLPLKSCRSVRIVETDVAYSLEQIMSSYDGYIERGYEGFIIRHTDAPYIRRRSTMVMKFKPKKEDYYTIVGYVEEVSIQGFNKGSLGALICKDDMGTIFKVGTGPALTRDARLLLWKERDTLPGRIAKVKYQHLTEKKVPRFPVLVEVVNPKTMFKI